MVSLEHSSEGAVVFLGLISMSHIPPFFSLVSILLGVLVSYLAIFSKFKSCRPYGAAERVAEDVGSSYLSRSVELAQRLHIFLALAAYYPVTEPR